MASSVYQGGYEPSAPSAPLQADHTLDPSSYDRSRQSGESFPSDSIEGAYPSQRTVGEYILSVFGKAARSVLRTSHTVARVDLLRPHRRKGPIFTSSKGERDELQRGAQNGPPSGAYYRQPRSVSPNLLSRGAAADGTIGEDVLEGSALPALKGRGARLKLMQIWDFPDKETGKASLPLGLNFGVGANFDMDQSELQPRLRVSTQNVSLHVLPLPEIEIKGKWALGISSMSVDLRCRVPLVRLGRIWDGDSGARILINLFHPVGTGIHLTPGGIEFDERVWRVGRHTDIRAAATLDFPRRIPIDEQPLRIQMHRLGIKTRIA